MKRILFVITILGCSMGVWAATDSFTFVSTLSAPVASFREVETKQSVVIPEGSQFNAGSVDSTEGNIVLNGTKPMKMDTLTMQNNTTISGSKQWLVDELTINTNGSVKVGSLIADEVKIDVPENDKAELTASNLHVSGILTMKEAIATSSLWVKNGTDSDFHFVGGGPTSGGKATLSSNIFVFSEN